MGLADARRPQQDHVLRSLDEARPGKLADDLAIQRGLELKVELVQRFDPRQPSQPQPTLDAALLAAPPFRFQGLGQKPLIVEVALGGLLADALEMATQVL